MAEEKKPEKPEDVEAFLNEVWDAMIGPAYIASNGLLEQFGQTPPEFLLHFTDARALISIIENQTLRVSRARASNDPNELNHGLDVAREEMYRVLAEVGAEETVKREFQAQILDSFGGRLGSDLDRIPIDPHMCCFTEPDRADEVAHWAMYGRDGAGFALKFHGEALDKNQNAALVKILYALEDQHVHMRKLMRMTWDASVTAAKYARDHHASDRHVDRIFATAAHALGGAMSIHAAAMKGPAFQAEREWRFIDSGMTDVPGKTFSFEPKGSIIRSFRDIKFNKSDLAEVIVGPVQAALNRPMVVKMLQRYGFETTKVTVGNVALRTLG